MIPCTLVVQLRNPLFRWLTLFVVGLVVQGLVLSAAMGPAAALGVPTSLDEELNQALDLEPDLENGKVLFEMCAGCHGLEAWGSVDGAFPQLAGQHRSVIIKQLSDFRQGNRANPAMEPFAEVDVLGPQGISDVGGYLASLPMTLNPGTGPGKNLALGEKVYDENCSVCHDDNAAGFDDFFFPKIQGQHYDYVLRQLIWMKDGKRLNVYHGMLRRIQKMATTDLEAVSDYVSRLPPTGDDDEDDDESDGSDEQSE